jgi:uncharacterized membrane protein
MKIGTVFLLISAVWFGEVLGVTSMDTFTEGLMSPEQIQMELMQDSDTGVSESSDLTLFFGRFHPFLVHLPIGLLLFAFLLEFVSRLSRFNHLSSAVPFTLLMGILSGIAAGVTGYLLSQGGGYSEDLLSSHRWLGITMLLLAVIVYLLRVSFHDHDLLRRIYRFLMILLAGLVIATGHYGGSLTHGSDYLFRYMPETLQSWVGFEAETEEEQIALLDDLDSAKVYDDIIHPIIRTRCQSCHNYDRTEGDLLLISYDHILAGGENGPVISGNSAVESELFRRLILPDRDEDRMPPRGRRQLTNDQIKLIEWWIETGVPSVQTVSELEISDEISGILQKLTTEGQSFYDRVQVAAAEPEILRELHECGYRISPIAANSNFLQVMVSKSKTSLTADEIELLLPLSEQITWLDLSRLDLSESDLSLLEEFHNLTRLNLSSTGITDGSMEFIGNLQNLKYLNIYDTNITDAGIQYLERSNNLNSLYLWKTHVTPEAINSLQTIYPDLYINAGYQLSAETSFSTELGD